MNDPEQDFLASILALIACELVYAQEKNPTSKLNLNTLYHRIVKCIRNIKREIK